MDMGVLFEASGEKTDALKQFERAHAIHQKLCGNYHAKK
jgi:hypothetical protein